MAKKVKEVVINAQHGGFGMSYAACMAYAKAKGFKLYGYMYPRKDDGSGMDMSRYLRVTTKNAKEAPLGMIHYSTRDLGKEFSKDKGFDNDAYWSDKDVERHDPALVATVRKLGSKANGECATLAVVEIPDEVEYSIEEYDGWEHVAEKHRTWAAE